ncbi:MAG: UvrD-helicase domain-containing protein [Bacteroides sp.]|nr:UvrD-helicase domain-containing protein [Bacteroides sp.]MCM1413962.1 UvrD-helicase domain-containing protein [Bacteroides sp.]MCM1471821.1 UvrD-helicase domain-containing protein [Bacteroides sp.]
MLSVYKASAGSGKTYRLTYKYIKLLLGVKDHESGQYRLNGFADDASMRNRHRHILAVTFTNKATDEMKRRIIHELAVLGGMEPGWTKKSSYEGDLCKELHCNPAELKTAAAKALRQLLFDFNFFQVSTIDSFFQSILRTFAREVDIPGNYDVDLESDMAIGQGVKELFDSLQVKGHASGDLPLVDWISNYLMGEFDRGKSVNLFNRSSRIHNEFLGLIKNICNDDFFARYDELMQYLQDEQKLRKLAEEIGSKEQSLIKDMREACQKAVELIFIRGYDPTTESPETPTVKDNLFNQLKDTAEKGLTDKKSASGVLYHKTGYLFACKKNLADKLKKEPDPDLESAIMRACFLIDHDTDRIKLYREVRRNLFVLGLLKGVFDKIEDYRKENNMILLSDTNTFLRRIIGDDTDRCAPFIYERIGVRLDHYLIDEFQDTSTIQWENLAPLLLEGLSKDEESLIIGDEKQCIYRFRFSDPSLLQSKVRGQFNSWYNPEGTDEKGNTNWRSSCDVVEFNNDLFDSLVQTVEGDVDGIKDFYANVRQKVCNGNLEKLGFVSVALFDKPASNTAKSKSYMSFALAHMTNEIVRQLRAGYLPSDITILTRFNTEGTLVIDHIMKMTEKIPELKNVRIMSDDAMELKSSPAVKLILSHLRFAAMPGVDNAVGAVDSDGHRSVFARDVGRVINKYEQMMCVTDDPDISLTTALQAVADNTDKAEDFDRLMADSAMACFNLPSLVENIIAEYLSPEMVEEQNMYITAFVDVVTEFCSRGVTDLNSFLQWWDDTGYKSKISAPHDENAIRVMSIHKSKGLEFKCVHIPFAAWRMIDFRDSEWFVTDGSLDGIDSSVEIPAMLPLAPGKYMENTVFRDQYRRRYSEQMLDEINVLYVAMTRAINELIISCPKPGKEYSKVSDFINELAPGLPEMRTDVQSVFVPPVDASDETMEASCMLVSRGAPTKPESTSSDKSQKKHSALDPVDSMSMVPYTSGMRQDLWSKIKLEDDHDYNSRRQRGIILHDVLAMVRRADDLSEAVARSVSRGQLPEDEAEKVEAFLRRRLSEPEVKGWFDDFKKLKLERPMHMSSGEAGRADRIVWTADGHVDVVDYKFARAEKDKDDHLKVRNEYKKQVRGYMESLRSMGYENVRGFLWYVDTGEVVPVSESATALS